jgi:hypothetical protein
VKHPRVILFLAAFWLVTASAPLAALAEPTEPEPIPGFSSDQMQRLRELRAWLQARKLQRLSGGIEAPEPRPKRQVAISDGRQLLTPLGQRYAQGFQKYPPRRETPILRIGRGPDGRIQHHYVFPEEEQADFEMEGEDETERPAATPRAKGRRPAGSIASRQRMVRIWAPEPLDQRISPRLDYEVSDQRR